MTRGQLASKAWRAHAVGYCVAFVVYVPKISVPLRSNSLLSKLASVNVSPDIPVTFRVNVVRPTLATQAPPTTCIPCALLARWWLMVLSVRRAFAGCDAIVRPATVARQR